MENEEPPSLTSEITKNERDWAMLTHLSALAGYLFSAGYLNFAGPLIIWLIKREEMPFVDDQGKESLNFQITMFLGMLISIPLAFVFIGFLTAIAFWVIGLIFTIVAAIKSQEGIRYRYPLCLRLIS